MTLAGCAMAWFNADGLITEARDYWHLQEGHERNRQELWIAVLGDHAATS
jgi:hypothetical protein